MCSTVLYRVCIAVISCTCSQSSTPRRPHKHCQTWHTADQNDFCTPASIVGEVCISADDAPVFLLCVLQGLRSSDQLHWQPVVTTQEGWLTQTSTSRPGALPELPCEPYGELAGCKYVLICCSLVDSSSACCTLPWSGRRTACFHGT